MSAALKGAVIGCGRMGAFTSASVREWGPDCFLPSAHAEAIAMADGADLVALCDASSENLARAGDHYAVEKRYTDHTELLAQETPDLIGLATRTIGRAGIIQDCIAAGARALHLEKPLCNSVAE
ncbi:MAG: Gfo/Idh/MocA family oxidoreductase, partial [Erythrobacter sp.]|nr:Gfo/Idh/MocA family oxidoreductase [Erythrobacter sp.]